LVVILGLLVVGSCREPPAAIMILTPLLLPVVEAAGVNAIHFGIILAVNLSIGMYTPPFGLNLFASQAIFKQPLISIYRGVIPFVLINFSTLMLITYVPAISMWLVGSGRLSDENQDENRHLTARDARTHRRRCDHISLVSMGGHLPVAADPDHRAVRRRRRLRHRHARRRQPAGGAARPARAGGEPWRRRRQYR